MSGDIFRCKKFIAPLAGVCGKCRNERNRDKLR
jgi:hypothetical protein